MVNEQPPAGVRERSPREELFNSVSHGIGIAAALVASPFLIRSAADHDKPWGIISAIVFVTSLILMYSASTLYHALPPGSTKRVLRRVEHGAIFLLIAGTYTPFTLMILRGGWGWSLFVLIWCLALLGIVLKGTATTKHRWLPGVLYLGMSWLVILAVRPLMHNLPQAGLIWLLWGGIAYTVGLAFYAARYVPYCHFVWHLFVLAGSACHFVAIWRYVV